MLTKLNNEVKNMDIVTNSIGFMRYNVDKAADYNHKGIIRYFCHKLRIGGVEHEMRQVVMLQSGKRTVLLEAMFRSNDYFSEDVNAAIERICAAADINSNDFKLNKYAYNEGELCYEYDPTND